MAKQFTGRNGRVNQFNKPKYQNMDTKKRSGKYVEVTRSVIPEYVGQKGIVWNDVEPIVRRLAVYFVDDDMNPTGKYAMFVPDQLKVIGYLN